MREKLTKSDVEKIREEIEHRKLVERKELIEAVKEARSHGDLSENFEYHAAKKEKNRKTKRYFNRTEQRDHFTVEKKQLKNRSCAGFSGAGFFFCKNFYFLRLKKKRVTLVLPERCITAKSFDFAE